MRRARNLSLPPHLRLVSHVDRQRIGHRGNCMPGIVLEKLQAVDLGVLDQDSQEPSICTRQRGYSAVSYQAMGLLVCDAMHDEHCGTDERAQTAFTRRPSVAM